MAQAYCADITSAPYSTGQKVASALTYMQMKRGKCPSSYSGGDAIVEEEEINIFDSIFCHSISCGYSSTGSLPGTNKG